MNRYILVLLAAAAIATVTVISSCSKRPTPEKRIVAPAFSTVSFTGSMQPMYKGGETILIMQKNFDKLEVGMVVVVWWEARELNVIHQIISKGRAANGELYYVTKGINNLQRDNHVLTADNFVGYVIPPSK